MSGHLSGVAIIGGMEAEARRPLSRAIGACTRHCRAHNGQGVALDGAMAEKTGRKEKQRMLFLFSQRGVSADREKPGWTALTTGSAGSARRIPTSFLRSSLLSAVFSFLYIYIYSGALTYERLHLQIF